MAVHRTRESFVRGETRHDVAYTWRPTEPAKSSPSQQKKSDKKGKTLGENAFFYDLKRTLWSLSVILILLLVAVWLTTKR